MYVIYRVYYYSYKNRIENSYEMYNSLVDRVKVRNKFWYIIYVNWENLLDWI